MPLPSTGYATAAVSNPTAALTDFTLLIDLSRLPASWWAAVDTSDGTRGRAAKDDGTELACDWIAFDDVAETGWLRVKWTGTLAATGTQTLRIYPPQAANAAVAGGDTYGSDNAYDGDWLRYWPEAGGTDRTSKADATTARGGVTMGGAAGQIAGATDFDGVDDYVEYGGMSSEAGTFPLTLSVWLNASALDAYPSLISTEDAPNYGGARIQLRLDGGVEALIGDGAGTASYNRKSYVTAAGVITTGAGWQMATIVFTSFSNVTVYVDGVAESATAGGEGTAMGYVGGASKAAMGRRQAGNFFYTGLLEEGWIHSAARSAAWIGEEHSQTGDNAAFWGAWSWTAGGGAGPVDLVAAAPADASAAAALALDHLVAAAAEGSTQAQAALTVARVLSASAGAEADASAEIERLTRLAATADSVATADAALAVASLLSAETVADATAEAALVRPALLTAEADGLATASAGLDVMAQLEFATAAGADAGTVATLARTLALAVTAESMADAEAHAHVARLLAADASAESGATAALLATGVLQMAATATGTAQAEATLTTRRLLAAESLAEAGTIAAAYLSRRMTGTAASDAGATAQLVADALLYLTAEAAALAGASAALRVAREVAAEAPATTTAAASMQLARLLSAIATGTSTAEAAVQAGFLVVPEPIDTARMPDRSRVAVLLARPRMARLPHRSRTVTLRR